MPDFNDLGARLHTDMSGLDWPAAGDIRASGNRRGRMQLATGAAAAVVAAVILAVGVWLPHGSQPSVGPAASPSVTAGLSATPSPSATASPTSTGSSSTVGLLPQGVLLTKADLAPTFAGAEAPFRQAYSPNPFEGCGPDTGMPGGFQPSAIAGTGFTTNGPQALLGGETVMRFPPGDAHRAMTAIGSLIAGVCAGQFQLAYQDPNGDESMIVTTTDPDTVVSQAAHGMAVYYSLERHGDYLVWVTIVDQAHLSGATDLARTLAARAVQRLCAAVVC